MKKVLGALAVAGVSSLAFAEGSTGFDPAAVASDATTTVTNVATAIGGLLVAAIAIYGAFLGYRKIREGLNKA